MTKRVLAISPHSDDVELGLGGYLHRIAGQGAEITVAVIASGSASFTKAEDSIASAIRAKEGLASGKVLGVKTYRFLNLAPDGAFGSVPRGSLVKELEALFTEAAWDQVFLPLPSFHTDHTVAFEACISAMRVRRQTYFTPQLLAYEYPAQAWGPPPPTTGKVYAPLTDGDLAAKITSLARHKTQWVSVADAPLIGLNAVKALAKLRGSECDAAQAEMFYLLRAVI